MTGQVCMAIKRIYVPANRRDEFLDSFTRATDAIVVGDGLEPAVTMGPLHTRKAQVRAEGLLNDASRRGAQVNSLGKIDDDATFARGYFMRPTVVTDLPDDAPLMTEEQFCPAIPVTTYEDVDEAVARANQTRFGLSGSVWSGNIDTCLGQYPWSPCYQSSCAVRGDEAERHRPQVRDRRHSRIRAEPNDHDA
jgi:acyl-CoA reductase-like NAD-dependent aldehyde dehydrogenase